MAEATTLPLPKGEKRTEPVTVHMPPSLRKVVDELADHEERTLSTFICRIVERDPLVKAVLQRVEGSAGN